MAEGKFKPALLTGNRIASPSQKCSHDSSNALTGESFKEATLSSCLHTTLSPNRSKVKRRVTFLEDYADGPTSSNDLSTENASHVAEDKPTVKDTVLTRASSGRPDVFPQSPDLSRQTWPTRQSPSTRPSAPEPVPCRLTDLAHFQTEMEASIDRLLQLTTDLEIATVVPAQCAADYRDCGVPQLWTAFQPNLSEDRPLQVDGYDCKQKPKQHADGDKAVKLLAPPAFVSPQSMMNTPQPIPTLDNHGQTCAPPQMTHDRQKPTEITKVSGWSEGPSGSLCGSRPLPPSTSELLAVLRGLLDLIDQHWNGNFSLHLNPSFLEQAYNILTNLKSTSHNEIVEKRGTNNSATTMAEESKEDNSNCTEIAHLRRQLAQEKEKMTCVQKKLVTALMDNIKLKNQMKDLRKDNSSWHNMHRQWCSCLELQEKVLEEEEKHFKGLKDSLEILQSTHRSLQRLSNRN
ncbi:hypothetical protein ACEWY4_015311 [Coilia grayii]|uniref:Uncharacterized protein n=1 Tax=Coilia grayii TaxID=363190 RepID=A0ABD1JMQ5_9TELE